MSLNMLSPSALYFHYMFRPNWPSSAVQVGVLKESATRCNVALLSYVVASDTRLCG
jgi:hypothetical protein